jgi:hypothetical protein
LTAFLAFGAAFFFPAAFAVPAFFVIGASQQINSHSLHPQASSTQTTIPHSSQPYRSPSFAFGITLSSFNVLFITQGDEAGSRVAFPLQEFALTSL